ncbi:nicotinic acetylcholine receptor alpha subunit 63b, partial [Brachionus plicatilis]
EHFYKELKSYLKKNQHHSFIKLYLKLNYDDLLIFSVMADVCFKSLSKKNRCEDEKRLQEKLISGYNRLVRPVEKNIDTLDLKLGIKLIQILDIVRNQDEKNQIMITKVWVKHVNLKVQINGSSNIYGLGIHFDAKINYEKNKK